MTNQNNQKFNTESDEQLQSSRIQAMVMRRVHIIYVLELFSTTTVLSFCILLMALWGIGREVWVARVFRNMPSITNVTAVTHFYLAAFLDTRFIVQVLTVVTIGAFVWFVYDFSRQLRFVRFA